ncbi:MAG TPA: pirin family protein [Polyangiaceae bacterium]|nr:pirin family protein [Polyangiaceae bacterium]
MISIRRSEERGHADHGWLDSRHTFSFASYYDPRHMGFRALRVINEDRVAPGAGFPTHAHRDMEIISYVLEGAIAHKDSTGHAEVLRPGEVQRMSAGKGVSHSEFNASNREPLHFLQIWILPERAGIEPGYEQRAFPAADRSNRWRLVASPTGEEGSLTIHQDVRLYAALVDPGITLEQALERGRHAWLQVARGSVQLEGERLEPGDGAAISEVERVRVTALEPAELLLFDLA